MQAWLLDAQEETTAEASAAGLAAAAEGLSTAFRSPELAEEGATSALLSEQFEAHDAWVQSLKDSAEQVLRRHKETQSAFAAAGIAPTPL